MEIFALAFKPLSFLIMSSQKKAVSIDKVPVEVAQVIAAKIFEWAESQPTMFRNRVQEREKTRMEEGESKRKRKLSQLDILMYHWPKIATLSSILISLIQLPLHLR